MGIASLNPSYGLRAGADSEGITDAFNQMREERVRQRELNREINRLNSAPAPRASSPPRK